MISFRRGKTKVCIITEERLPTTHNNTPLYTEGIHMLDGLADEEVDEFLEDHPTIIPLFEIDAISTIDTPPNGEVMENSLAQDKPEPFHVFVDASDIAISNALMKSTPPNWYRPVYYASQRLSTAEKNYSTTEREALGMV